MARLRHRVPAFAYLFMRGASALLFGVIFAVTGINPLYWFTVLSLGSVVIGPWRHRAGSPATRPPAAPGRRPGALPFDNDPERRDHRLCLRAQLPGSGPRLLGCPERGPGLGPDPAGVAQPVT